MRATPRISVVVPAREAARHIAACLESILRSGHPGLELIVVDDASNDDTASIASSRGARVIRNEARMGPAASRNIGAAACGGDYIFFTDSDCEAGEGWIRAGCESLENPGTVAVEGAVRYARSEIRLYHKVPLNPFYNHRSGGRLTVGGQDFGAASFAVKRSAFEAVSGFDAATFPNGREDTDLAYRLMRIGGVVTNEAMIVVHRDGEWDPCGLRENSRRYEADVVFAARHGTFPYKLGPALHPRFLAITLLPPLILLLFPPRTLKELAFLPRLYGYFLRVRLAIWRAALRESVWIV